MKKGLLLSVAASAVIFAGGDIAPVEPAAPAADFWGQIGFFYQAQDNDDHNPATVDFDFGDEDNNNFAVTAVLGVEKEIGMGFGVGLELAGWSGLGWDLGDAMLFKADGLLGGNMNNGGEVSQAYLTYTFGNTAIKVGRQALPKAVSPWAYSSRTGGVIDVSYDGIVIANTDLQDTTLVFAWVDQAYTAPNMPQRYDSTAGQAFNGQKWDLSNVEVSDGAGLFMLGLINKSLANTTLSLAAYYIPESKLNGLVNNFLAANSPLTNRVALEDTWSIWASAVGTVNNINWGLQFAYVDGDEHMITPAGATVANSGWDATYGVAAKVGSSWGDFDAELVVGYINDGDYSLRTAGYGGGSPSAFWTFNGDFGGDRVRGEDQWAIIAKAGYKLGNGKLYGNIGYWEFDEELTATTNLAMDNAFDVRLGYKFKIMDIDAQVEYRYLDVDRKNNTAAGLINRDTTRQRIRVEAYYKF